MAWCRCGCWCWCGALDGIDVVRVFVQCGLQRGLQLQLPWVTAAVVQSGRHQEQAPKQRCTFSPTTFSSVQFSSVQFKFNSVQFSWNMHGTMAMAKMTACTCRSRRPGFFFFGSVVPIRSWTRTLRPPGIRHRHLPCHAMPCQFSPRSSVLTQNPFLSQPLDTL